MRQAKASNQPPQMLAWQVVNRHRRKAMMAPVSLPIALNSIHVDWHWPCERNFGNRTSLARSERPD